MQIREQSIEEFENKLREVIVNSDFFSINPSDRTEITVEDKLLDDLSIDSIKLLELLLKIEDELGLNLDYEDLTMEAFENIRSLAGYLHTKLLRPA